MKKTCCLCAWVAVIVWVLGQTAAAEPGGGAAGKAPVLKHSEIVFMSAADDESYKAYRATFVGWGGASTKEQVERHHKLGIRCTGSMWCLTAGAKRLHENPDLLGAVAVDIEGKPIAVPWLFDHTYKGTPSYFGCTNSPAFRAHNRDMVRQQMAGGADGLHVDDHMGVSHSAHWQGGGLCDHCMAAFRGWLKAHAGEAAIGKQLKDAGVAEIEKFDYRDIIRKHAKTRAEYKKVQRKIPLMDLFLRFHGETAAENVRQLGELATQVAGHPTLLSANAGLPSNAHAYVLPKLTHVICEVGQNAASGTGGIGHAIEGYRMAAQLGRPMAATASGHDWAFANENNPHDLVRFWVAVAYAHGQRFMVPHPTRQWCFTSQKGTHWYAAPVNEFAPVYQFISANAAWFDGFEEDASDAGLKAVASIEGPRTVLCTLRRRADGAAALHVLNLDYDKATKKFRPAEKVALRVPASLLPAGASKARLLSYDAKETQVALPREAGKIRIDLPALRLWTVVAIPKP